MIPIGRLRRRAWIRCLCMGASPKLSSATEVRNCTSGSQTTFLYILYAQSIMDCFTLCNTQSMSELILVHTSHNAAHNTSKPDRAVRLRLVLLKLLPSLGPCLAGTSSSAYSHDKDRATRKKDSRGCSQEPSCCAADGFCHGLFVCGCVWGYRRKDEGTVCDISSFSHS